MSYKNVKNLTNDFTILGHVAWLWANSPLHKDWPISLFAKNILPAIQHNQYVLLMRDEFPVAFCCWANLTLANEVKYVCDVTSLTLEDWNSGERKWFIDWIAPFGDNNMLYQHMRKKFPYDVFRAIRVYPGSTEAKIIHVQGGKVDKSIAKKLKQQYQEELTYVLNNLTTEKLKGDKI
ncbi:MULTISPECIES: toxin-activating lysine-acyltransferase [Glaesserella]|uniref:RTX toxin-activating lysine-acyltransferase n=1 Tax=Glaesserella australis TaxID=2094024 RepID=A0A328BWE6_9PAST|nr:MULTISPECIES: toxin-activating lysine-acyltransferase [Glaesserella]AUI65284.1 toxin-activating lysine-acyltransferase [Glaesserella sp. 15-184]RAL18556.1 toxin-activating lysine-acyltransferase [Glaesserella australis]